MVTCHRLKCDHALLVSQPPASPIILPLQANRITGNGRLALRKSQWRWKTLTEQKGKATTRTRGRQKTDTTMQDNKYCLVFHRRTPPRKRKSPKLKCSLFYNHYRCFLWWALIAETCSQHPGTARMEHGPPICVYCWEQRTLIRGDIPAGRYLPNIGRGILLGVDLSADGPASPPALHHRVRGRRGDFILPRVCTAARFLQVLDLLCLLLKNYKFIKRDPASVLFTGVPLV